MRLDRSIVVALSGTASDERLIRYATRVANLSRATEVEPPDAPLSATHHDAPSMVAQRRAIVVTAPQTLRFVKAEDAREASAEDGTDVVLIGEEGRGSDSRRLARRLIHESASSVWFVPNGEGESLRRFLVPVDFSTRAADSLRVATSLGHLAGSGECLTLNVYFNDALVAVTGQDQRLREGLADAHAQFMTGIDSLGVRVTPRFREGIQVGRAIARVADEEAIDLIVMASRGRTTAGALILESVAEQTLRETRVPLLVVKHFGASLGLLAALREKLFWRKDELRFN